MATLIKKTGEKVEVKPKNGTDFDLKELYELIGCEMVQCVPFGEGKSLWIDEEGKLVDNWQDNINHEATKEWIKLYGDTDRIVGNALICEEGEVL